jgi:hypothetical protein
VLIARLAGEHPHSSQAETLAELREMCLVREVLETAALTAAARAADAADDEAVAAAHRAMECAVRDGDALAYHRESRAFHLALVRPCGMRRLLGMFESAWNITESLQSMTHLTATERATLQRDHDEIVAAFVARDTEALPRTPSSPRSPRSSFGPRSPAVAGSPAAALAMVFKLVESAQARRRAITGVHLVALVRSGARFENGVLVEREVHAA